MSEWTILVIGHENGLASGPSDPFSGHPQHYPRIDVVEKDAAMARIRELEAQELKFIQTLCVQSEEAKELGDRIALLEAENQRLRRALQHVQFYALDNVPEELREMAKAVLQEDKPQ